MNKTLRKRITRLVIKDLQKMTEDHIQDLTGIRPYSLAFDGVTFTTPDGLHSLLMKNQKAYAKAKKWLVTEGVLDPEDLTLANNQMIEEHCYFYFVLQVMEDGINYLKENEELDLRNLEWVSQEDMDHLIRALKTYILQS